MILASSTLSFYRLCKNHEMMALPLKEWIHYCNEVKRMLQRTVEHVLYLRGVERARNSGSILILITFGSYAAFLHRFCMVNHYCQR
jgi:hypothetical protein